ncbi:rhomboid-like protein [Mycobacterium sp.]|uniref:rhomboid-like protein n=1 Tax=Mycobacterium sp. TaxID=1785 RepID=UPI003F98F9BA
MTIVDTAVRDRADTAVTAWYGRGATPVLPERTVLRFESRWTATATRALSVVASLRVTIVYAVALIAVSTTLTALGPHARDVVVSRMSTNLHNLARGHLSTLVGSAFVDDGGEVYAWLPGLVCLLALGELIWRSTGLLIAFTLGHIGATLLVAVGLVTAVQAGWVPISIAHASDVGVSYGAVCVLGALTASIPARWRPVWIGWWLGITATAAWATEFDFTAVGHVLALLLGMGVSFRLPSMARWSSLHLALLAVGVAVGYFMVSGSSMVATAGGLAGILLAFLAGGILRSRSGYPHAVYQPQPCFTTMS